VKRVGYEVECGDNETRDEQRFFHVLRVNEPERRPPSFNSKKLKTNMLRYLDDRPIHLMHNEVTGFTAFAELINSSSAQELPGAGGAASILVAWPAAASGPPKRKGL
jgi:hypothetical protein